MFEKPFQIQSPYQPTGDQPAAIEALVQGFREGKKYQTLMGVTGSGKTFTMATRRRAAQPPALVISHNKTLAAQLYEEFKELFPNNAVGYFVSYYDYYQPEAYIPQRDIYIEKDAAATTTSTACASPPPATSSAAATCCSSPPSPASSASARRRIQEERPRHPQRRRHRPRRHAPAA